MQKIELKRFSLLWRCFFYPIKIIMLSVSFFNTKNYLLKEV